MRILIGTDNFYPNVNGAAHFTERLTRGLVKNGHEVFVIAPSTKFKNTTSKYQGITVYGMASIMIPTLIHPAKIRIPFMTNPVLVEKLVSRIRPEVVHIQDHFMIGNYTINAARKLAIPILGTNHFMPDNLVHYIDPLNLMKKPLLKLAWQQFISIYKHLDLITTPTCTAASLLKKLGLKKPVIPISCGVDLNKFSPKKNGYHLKDQLKIARQKPVILFVGRLDKEKNVDLIITAFAKTLPSINAQLVIVGQGKEKLSLIKLAKKLGVEQNTTFANLVADKNLPGFYRMADLFAIASIAELQSIATMEAMASGLPVVAVKAMALPELVHHGKNGYLFDEGDSETLTKYLTKILKNPTLRKRMSTSSLKIISHHSLEATINSYEKVYQKLTSKQVFARSLKTSLSTSKRAAEEASLAKKRQPDSFEGKTFSAR